MKMHANILRFFSTFSFAM